MTIRAEIKMTPQILLKEYSLRILD